MLPKSSWKLNDAQQLVAIQTNGMYPLGTGAQNDFLLNTCILLLYVFINVIFVSLYECFHWNGGAACFIIKLCFKLGKSAVETHQYLNKNLIMTLWVRHKQTIGQTDLKMAECHLMIMNILDDLQPTQHKKRKKMWDYPQEPQTDDPWHL